jgi:hypothetical protein
MAIAILAGCGGRNSTPALSSNSIAQIQSESRPSLISLSGESLKGHHLVTHIIGNVYLAQGSGLAYGPYPGSFHVDFYVYAGQGCHVHDGGSFDITSGAYHFSGGIAPNKPCKMNPYSASVTINGVPSGTVSGVMNIKTLHHPFLVIFK